VNDVMKQLDRMWQIRDLGMTFSDFMREMELEVRARGAPGASLRARPRRALAIAQLVGPWPSGPSACRADGL